MLTDTVKILVEKARAGDGKSFGELFRLFYRPLFRFIVLRVRNRLDAEDLTQLVFVKALESIDRYEERNTFHSWLYTIARNSIIDHYKKKKSALLSEEDMFTLRDEGPGPVEQAEAADDADEIREALGRLKPEYREVVELRFLQELSVRETADLLGLSEDNVRQRQSRALKELRKYFNVS